MVVYWTLSWRFHLVHLAIVLWRYVYLAYLHVYSFLLFEVWPSTVGLFFFPCCQLLLLSADYLSFSFSEFFSLKVLEMQKMLSGVETATTLMAVGYEWEQFLSWFSHVHRYTDLCRKYELRVVDGLDAWYRLSLLMEEEGHHLQVIAEAVMAAVVVVEGVMAFLGILITEVPL